MPQQASSTEHPPFLVALMSGGLAGTSVDVALFPLDTVKTRLQAAEGFWKSGGFRGVYRGLSVAAAGSAPGAALFFSTYEMSKQQISKRLPGVPAPFVHMASAAFGEVAACLIRVPTEVVKQRMQAGKLSHVLSGIASIYKSEGLRGFYRGYGATVLREIPFSFIQFPLYEFFKHLAAIAQGKDAPDAHIAALCGSVAGATAAGLTTPLDVAKTRLMLGADLHGVKYLGTMDTLRRVYAENGPRSLFAGVLPRMTWISIGGFVFFGVYEKAKRIFSNVV